jgi:NhaA family Na+:H+ antiporter
MHIPPRSRGRARVKADRSYAARQLLLPLQRFVHTETNGAFVLLAAAIAALVWANLGTGASYENLWNSDVALRVGAWSLSHTLREWINDALMVVFFFVVGLEIKRELVHGELSGWKRSALPVICAAGGMIVPAALYAAFNAHTNAASGWGIPMATDIAFALGVLALLGDRLPSSVRVFLLALAVVDDIGAILVIAVFYTPHLEFLPLIAAFVVMVLIMVMQRLQVRTIWQYIPISILFWFAVLESGIHATLAGVVLGLITPTRPDFAKSTFAKKAENLVQKFQSAVTGEDNSTAEGALGELEQLTISTEAPAERLVRLLHPWSSYLVLPIFALANAGVPLSAAFAREALSSHLAQGIAAGLILGKAAGITAFAYVAIRLRLASPIPGVHWLQMTGIALLAGIGFTVSLFITDLAFTDPSLVGIAKIAVLAASFLAGIGGFALLRTVKPPA